MPRIPILAPGDSDLFFNGTSVNKDGLLQDPPPEVLPAAEVPTPDAPQLTTEPPANFSVEPSAVTGGMQVTAEPVDEFANVEGKTKRALMAFIQQKLQGKSEKIEGSIFDQPEFKKGNMALYYAGLGKELPAEYFGTGGAKDDSSRLNAAVGALNALRGMKGKNEKSTDPMAADSIAMRPFTKQAIRMLPSVSAEEKQTMLDSVDSLGAAQQDALIKNLGLGQTARSLYGQSKTDERFDKGLKEKIRESDRNYELAFGKTGIMVADKINTMQPAITAFQNLEREVPGITNIQDVEKLDSVLKAKGMSTWSNLAQKDPTGALIGVNSKQAQYLAANAQGIANIYIKSLAGSAVSEQEQKRLEIAAQKTNFQNPGAFFKWVNDFKKTLWTSLKQYQEPLRNLDPIAFEQSTKTGSASYLNPMFDKFNRQYNVPGYKPGKKVIERRRVGDKLYDIHSIGKDGTPTDWSEVEDGG